jgi:hypothetical protein
VNYKEEMGDCDVPARHATKDGIKLAASVRRQRSPKEKLSEEQKHRLNELGFERDT